MRVSFMNVGSASQYSYFQNCSTAVKNSYSASKERKRAIEDLGFSISAGAFAGIMTASVMYRKNNPRILFNSLEIAAVVSGFAYVMTLLADKFYNNK